MILKRLQTIWFFVPLYMAVCFALTPPRYLTNDNLAMLANFEQGFSIKFSSYLFGRLIFALHGLSDWFPWYGVLLYLGHALAFALLLDCLQRQLPAGGVRQTAMICLVVVYTPFIYFLDYTAVSILLSGAGLLTCLTRGLFRRDFAFGGLLLFGLLPAMGYLIRLKGPLAALVFSLPLFLPLLRRPRSLIAVGVFLLPLVFVGGVDKGLKAMLTDQATKDYIAFDRLRGKFHEYPISKSNPNKAELLAQNNWTPNDYNRLRNWFFFDESKYNLETMANIYRLQPARPGLSAKVSRFLSGFGGHLGRIVVNNKIQAVFLLFAVLCALRLNILWTCVCLTYSLLGMVFMSIFFRFYEQIAWPLIVLVGVNFLLLPSLFSRERGGPKMPATVDRVRLMVTGALCLVGMVLFLARDLYADHQAKAAFRKEFAEINRTYRDAVFLIQPGYGIPREMINPFSSYRPEFHEIRTGWNTFSPLFYQQIKALGIDEGREIIPAMMRNPNAYLIAQDDYLWLITNYIEENMGKNQVKVEKVGDFYFGAGIYRLVGTAE